MNIIGDNNTHCPNAICVIRTDQVNMTWCVCLTRNFKASYEITKPWYYVIFM